MHLLSQLEPDGILIPQNIAVDVCLTSQERENFATLVRRDADGLPVDHDELAAARVHLGRILELNARIDRACLQGQNGNGDTLPPVTVRVPPRPPSVDQLMLLTDVQVFESFRIHDYQSEVSHPVILYDLNGIESGAEVTFAYTFGRKPGFDYRVREPQAV